MSRSVDVAANRWTFKKRMLFIFLPIFLAMYLPLEVMTDNRLGLFDFLTISVEMFVFFYAVCLLLYGLVFHLFDFLKWVVQGMKETPND